MKNAREKLIYLAFVVASVIAFIVVLHHRNWEQQVNVILSEAESDFEKSLRKTAIHELSIVEVVRNKELHNELKETANYHARRLASLGPEAANAIASAGLKKYYFAHCYVMARFADLTPEEAQSLVEHIDHGIKLIFNNCQEVAVVYSSDTCFKALEMLGEAAVPVLEPFLSSDVVGAVSAYTLARMGCREVLKTHFNNENATDIERVNAATGLAALKDKIVLPFLLENLYTFNYPWDIQVATAITHFGELALPEVKKAWEQGKIGDFSYGVEAILWESADVTYQDHVRLEKVPRKEKRYSRTWCSDDYVMFQQDDWPEKEIAKYVSGIAESELLLIESGIRVHFGVISRIFDLIKKNDVKEFALIPLRDPGGNRSVYVHFITLYEPSGKPRITLQMLVFKLGKNSAGEDVAMLAFKDKSPEFIFPVSRKELYSVLSKAYYEFRPTESYKTLPVVLDPAPNVEMGAVIWLLVECCRAGIEDVNFAHHTCYCDWIVELEKYLKSKRDEKKKKSE